MRSGVGTRCIYIYIYVFLKKNLDIPQISRKNIIWCAVKYMCTRDGDDLIRRFIKPIIYRVSFALNLFVFFFFCIPNAIFTTFQDRISSMNGFRRAVKRSEKLNTQTYIYIYVFGEKILYCSRTLSVFFEIRSTTGEEGAPNISKRKLMKICD